MQEEQPKQLVTPKPIKTGKPWVMWVIVAIIAVVAGGLSMWMYNQTQNLQSQLNAKTTTLSQSEKDLTALQEKYDKLAAGTPAPATSDKDVILAAVDAYVRAPVAAQGQKFTYEISDNTGKFAKVKVGVAEGGGYTLTLKKVGANWTVLFGGQDLPLQDMADKYGLPKGYYQ